MTKPMIFLAALFVASRASAVELNAATNQQLIHELSQRLANDDDGGGGGGGKVFSIEISCGSGVFNSYDLKILNANFDVVANLTRYSQASCQSLIAAFPFGSSGRIRAGRTLAVCDHANLNLFGVLPDGSLKTISETWLPNDASCVEEMRKVNSKL